MLEVLFKFSTTGKIMLKIPCYVQDKKHIKITCRLALIKYNTTNSVNFFDTCINRINIKV